MKKILLTGVLLASTSFTVQAATIGTSLEDADVLRLHTTVPAGLNDHAPSAVVATKEDVKAAFNAINKETKASRDYIHVSKVTDALAPQELGRFIKFLELNPWFVKDVYDRSYGAPICYNVFLLDYRSPGIKVSDLTVEDIILRINGLFENESRNMPQVNTWDDRSREFVSSLQAPATNSVAVAPAQVAALPGGLTEPGVSATIGTSLEAADVLQAPATNSVAAAPTLPADVQQAVPAPTSAVVEDLSVSSGLPYGATKEYLNKTQGAAPTLDVGGKITPVFARQLKELAAELKIPVPEGADGAAVLELLKQKAISLGITGNFTELTGFMGAIRSKMPR